MPNRTRTGYKFWGLNEGTARLGAAMAVLAAGLTALSFADGPATVLASGGLIFMAGLSIGWWRARCRSDDTSSTEALHAKVFQATSEGATITDSNGIILAVNDSFTRMTGYLPDEVVGKNPSILSSGRHDHDFYQDMWRDILDRGSWEGEVYNQRKNGEIYPEWLRVTKITDTADGSVQYVGTFSDITQRKASEEKLIQRAYTDALTGAANRPYLNKFLDQEMSRVRRQGGCLACLFLDLDNFKPINDDNGHDAGDEMLRVIVQRIGEQLREVDLVARIGGDEFVVALLDCGSADDALQTANRILAMVRRPIPWQGQSFTLGCSGGIALYPDHARDRNDLIAAADQAMYRAKRKGGDYVALADPFTPRRKTSFG